MRECTIPATIRDLFDASLHAEMQGQQFYLCMSEAFAYLPPVAEFWRSLMLDESRHIAAVREIGAGLTDAQLDEPVDAAALERARSILNILTDQAIRAVRTLDDAYELAHEYESSELNRLFTFLATKFDRDGMRSSFIVHEIADHQSKLMRFTEQFGGRSWRVLIPALDECLRPSATDRGRRAS